MNGLESSGGRLLEFGKELTIGLPLTVASLFGAAMTAAAFVGAATLYLVAKKFGISVAWPSMAFDPNDMKVYADQARWVIEGGRLYLEVLSEYPLFANIIFATWLYLGN